MAERADPAATAHPDIALALASVDALYGDSHVLHGVSFTLRTGQLLALLGRNGAGKTTTLSSVIGFLPPQRGTIHLHGEPIHHLSPEAIARRGIGLVPQGRRVFPSLTVDENLRVAARPKADGTTPWTLDRVYDKFPRLRERRRQGAGSLSGGEQQMLAISRALVGNPRVLLLDEPSEGLAPQIVAEVGRVLEELKREGFSIVLVEQNTALALKVADAVAILNTGQIVFDDTAAALAGRSDVIQTHLGVY